MHTHSAALEIGGGVVCLISDTYFPTQLVHAELGACSRVSTGTHFQSQLWLEAALSFLRGVVKEPS